MDILKFFICRILFEHGSCLFPRADQDQIISTLKFLKTQFEKRAIEINSEEDLFRELKPLDNKTLIEYIVSKDDSWIRVREELIVLLKRIEDRNDNKCSKETLKKLMKKKLKTSPGLVGCLNSINDKYPWTKEKARSEKCTAFFANIILGWGLWAFDISTDIVFAESIRNKSYHGNLTRFDEESSLTVYNISIAHIVMPFFVSLVVFLIMVLPDVKGTCREKSITSLGRFPIPIFTKFQRFLIQIKEFDLKTETEENKMKENENEADDKRKSVKQKESKTDLEIQEAFVNLSLILEGTIESSFQLWFQVLYFFPVIVFFIRDSYEWFFGVRILSIGSSFVSYAVSIVNSR